jgi:hypothetical protein
VETIFYLKAGHGFTNSEDAKDFLDRVEAFLVKHNPS